MVFQVPYLDDARHGSHFVLEWPIYLPAPLWSINFPPLPSALYRYSAAGMDRTVQTQTENQRKNVFYSQL